MSEKRISRRFFLGFGLGGAAGAIIGDDPNAPDRAERAVKNTAIGGALVGTAMATGIGTRPEPPPEKYDRDHPQIRFLEREAERRKEQERRERDG